MKEMLHHAFAHPWLLWLLLALPLLGILGIWSARRRRQAVAQLGDLAAIEPRWEPFMRHQIAGCRARHARLGLPEKFLGGLDGFLADTVPLIPMRAPPVILIGEYIPENFLLGCEAGDWRFSGLFDFGDVLTGWGEYDLLGPSAFMTASLAPKRAARLLAGSFCR